VNDREAAKHFLKKVTFEVPPHRQGPSPRQGRTSEPAVQAELPSPSQGHTSEPGVQAELPSPSQGRTSEPAVEAEPSRKKKKLRYTTMRMTSGPKKSPGPNPTRPSEVPDVEMTDTAQGSANVAKVPEASKTDGDVDMTEDMSISNQTQQNERRRKVVRKQDLMVPKLGPGNYKVTYKIVDRMDYAALDVSLAEDERTRLKGMFDSLQMKHFQIRSDLASYEPFGPCLRPGHVEAVDAIRGLPDTDLSRPKVMDKDCMFVTQMKPDVFRWRQSILVHGIEKVKMNWDLFCGKGVIYKIPSSIYCDRTFVRSCEGIYYLASMENLLQDLLSKDVSDIPLEKLISFKNLPLRTAVDFGPKKWWWSARANRGWVYEQILRRTLFAHVPFDGHDASHLPLSDLSHYFKGMDDKDKSLSFPDIFNGIPTFVSYFYPSQLSTTAGLGPRTLRSVYLRRMHELESIYGLFYSFYNNWAENGRAFALPPGVLDIIRESGILDVELSLRDGLTAKDVMEVMEKASYGSFSDDFRCTIYPKDIGNLSQSSFWFVDLQGRLMRNVGKKSADFSWGTNVPFPYLQSAEWKAHRKKMNRDEARSRDYYSGSRNKGRNRRRDNRGYNRDAYERSNRHRDGRGYNDDGYAYRDYGEYRSPDGRGRYNDYGEYRSTGGGGQGGSYGNLLHARSRSLLHARSRSRLLILSGTTILVILSRNSPT